MLAPVTCPAATLHGRVKDQQCAVLSRVSVRVQALGDHAEPLHTLITDDSGNYTVDLAPGAYRVCMQRGSSAAICQQVDVFGSGDTWITTQLRDAAPDLSNFGNRAH